MKLDRSLYRLRDAAKIWHDLLTAQFREAILTVLRRAPYVYENEDKLVICYVNDLLMIIRKYRTIEETLEEEVQVKELG